MIVLTGGAGFIGSCFLKKLNDEGYKDIVVVDDLEHEDKWKNLVGKTFIEYIQKDTFIDLVQQGKIKDPDAIIHMGACSSTTCTDNEYLIKNNYEYSKKLALWAERSKVYFMYASSAATYGDGNQGYDDDHSKIKELAPLNMYGYSKQIFDLWILRNGYQKNTVGLKFFNVFGPNEYHKKEMMSIVCKKINDVSANGKITLFRSYKEAYKDGEQKRDFIYVKDAIDVMFFFFSHQDRSGIYNLGTGQAKTWNDIAFAMFKAVGKKPNIEYIEMPEYLKEKYQYFTEAKINKLRDAGYLKEFTPLEQAIKDYADYLLESKYL
ncbi:MAG: ADP-glyceromanno-heptose 6-epimerase [Candidatus Omnitrophica bacterium]|nr:ADP-glyceromanno-heptose 6-epimerase [Candidatus Omnitrophota bacterium]